MPHLVLVIAGTKLFNSLGHSHLALAPYFTDEKTGIEGPKGASFPAV